MIQLRITQTGKSYNSKDNYSVFNEDLKTFSDLDEARQFLKDEYGTCKRSKMFADFERTSIHTGYIYHFRNEDISHYPIEKWLQQDWVGFYETKSLVLSK